MANKKSKAASKKSASTRSRSAARKTTSARKTTAARSSSSSRRTVESRPPLAAEEPNVKAQEQAATPADREKLLDPAVQAAILGVDGEPLTSVNSLPKDQGGLPADEIARLRSVQESVTGAGALGQPGQKGHGVGTASHTIQGPMTDAEIEANEKEYQRRINA